WYAEGANDLIDRGRDENRRVEEHVVSKIGGEALLQRAHRVANLARHLDRVGSRTLVNAERRRRCAVEAAEPVLRFRAQFHAGDIPDADNRAVGIGAQDDGGELLGPGESATGLDVDLHLLLARDRSRADAAQRRLNILALDRCDDIVQRQVELRQPVGVEPDAQRIVERPKQLYLPDAFDPRYRINHVDRRI